MLPMISGMRLLNNVNNSLRSATTITVCHKQFTRQSKCLLYTKPFVGYAESKSLKYYGIGSNNAKYRITKRPLSSQTNSNQSSNERELEPVQFEKISGETLDSLTEYFDELVDQATHLPDADVSYGDGVLTIKFGEKHGTYVINRQTPNKQIWLSSPKSGPKRYDFIAGRWVYKHDGKSLHQLLDDEIPAVVKSETAFCKCLYAT